MTKRKTLIAIVVTFNRLNSLKVTVARLLETGPADLAKIVICDNASTDGTSDWLAQLEDPRIEIITLEKNQGGAGGFELALKDAHKRYDPDWYVLMDDDAYPEKGTIAHFHSQERSGQALWLSDVRYPDGEICEMNRPWVNPFWSTSTLVKTLLKGRDSFHLNQSVHDGADCHSVDGGSFVGLFVSRDALEKAGYPRGELFLYGDDVLFTLKARQSGGLATFDPKLRFCHACETFEAHTQVFSPLWKAYFYHRNIILVYREVAGPILFWPVLMLKYIGWRRGAKKYGSQSASFKRLLHKAMKDALTKTFGDTSETISSFIALPKSSNDNAAREVGQTRGR